MKKMKLGSLLIVLALVSFQVKATDPDGYREALERLADGMLNPLRAEPDSSYRKQQQRAVRGNWVVISESPLGIATLSADRQAGLAMGCTDEGYYLISAIWLEAGVLGTYYEDTERIPVALNWRRPDATQRQQWTRLDLSAADSVLISDGIGDESEVESFFTEVLRHEELQLVVTTRPGATKSATFQVAGAPVDRVRACGRSTPPPPPPPPTPTPTPTPEPEPEPVGTGPTLIFPQWVNGAYESFPFPNRTRLILRNLAGEEDPVTVTYFGGDGEVVNNETYTVPGRGTVDVWSDGRGDFVMGALTVDSDLGAQSQLRGTVVYELLGQRVSIPAAELVTEAEVFLSKSASENTSLVLYNPNNDPLELEFVMYTSQGRPFWRLYVMLEPGQHLARFMDADPLFSAYFRRRTEFTGHVVVSSGRREVCGDELAAQYRDGCNGVR